MHNRDLAANIIRKKIKHRKKKEVLGYRKHGVCIVDRGRTFSKLEKIKIKSCQKRAAFYFILGLLFGLLRKLFQRVLMRRSNFL